MTDDQEVGSSAQDAEADSTSPTQPVFQWPRTGAAPVPLDDASSPEGEDGQVEPGAKASVPMQKRRRVTRACDECRRKKIKCDGKQPCTHCTVYSYDCTYDQPSNRRRNPAPQYIEAIENRLHRAEALLKTVMPDVDLDDPDAGSALAAEGPHFPQPGYEKNIGGSRGRKTVKVEPGAETEKDSMLESMVENTGSLDLDDKGQYDFYGQSSGLVFLKRLRQQFGDLMGEAEGHGNLFLRAQNLQPVVDSPKSFTMDSPMASTMSDAVDLPSKACAQTLSAVALEDAMSLMRFIHRPTYDAMLDRIFDTPQEQWGTSENRYLPLVFAVMAVGSLFAKNENSKLQLEGYQTAIESGFKYFKATRHLMDITDCRDLPSIQTVICMIYFLQSSAKLSTCYSYIGIALHSAVRMGLHRSIKGNFNPIEAEIRKRIFWQIRKLDIYVGVMVGLPMMLSDDDIDQEYPLDVDDEYITVDRILPMPEGTVSLASAMNAHTTLVMILQKVNKYIYPLKPMNPGQSNSQTYTVSHARIREVEKDLQEWMENLPMGLRPGGTSSEQLIRAQQLLRIAYAHTQLFLYRPFLHYTTSTPNRQTVDKRSYACAAACVSVSRNIIHIVGEMNKKGLLIGAYWFTMYTSFMAILSLVFFVFENPNNASSNDIIKDAKEGLNILTSLAKRSMAADRCARTLSGLFEEFEKVRRNAAANTKKRNASPGPHPTGLQSAPDVTSQAASEARKQRQPQRASTFPNKIPANSTKRGSYPYPTYPSNLNNSSTTSPRNSYVHTPTSENMPGVMTPDTASSASHSSGMPYNAAFLNPQQNANQGQQQSMGMQTSGLPDLSPLMFPTGDPFAYPNQPLTTLEGAALDSKDFQLPQGLYSPIQPNTPTNRHSGFDQDLNGEVQIFGPLPPYLMHGQQPGMNMGLGLGNFQGEGMIGDGWNGPQDNTAREDWGWNMGGEYQG